MNNRYTDAVSAKYQDLVCMGFGTDNLGAVIKSVFNNLANLKGDCLPKFTFPRSMFTESTRLNQLHIAESLILNNKKSRNTLHSDRASKSGKHYETYNGFIGKG